MSYAADLHLHSSFAYACSKHSTLDNLAAWAAIKGIDLLASADFTHPVWKDELKRRLSPSKPGLFSFGGVDFVLGSEVSCVYRQGGRQRRVHLLLLVPDFSTVDRICVELARSRCNLDADGRPTVKMSARDLTCLCLDINADCIIVPAHAWTPWYGMFGSKSGFDSVEECFQDMSGSVRAVETGLSCDPAMIWSIPDLAGRSIVSFSDAHSPPKLGREVTVFEGELSYPGLAEALAKGAIAYTVEYYPQEGKYHHSGHRKCGVRQTPEETERLGSACPGLPPAPNPGGAAPGGGAFHRPVRRSGRCRMRRRRLRARLPVQAAVHPAGAPYGVDRPGQGPWPRDQGRGSRVQTGYP